MLSKESGKKRSNELVEDQEADWETSRARWWANPKQNRQQLQFLAEAIGGRPYMATIQVGQGVLHVNFSQREPEVKLLTG